MSDEKKTYSDSELDKLLEERAEQHLENVFKFIGALVVFIIGMSLLVGLFVAVFL